MSLCQAFYRRAAKSDLKEFTDSAERAFASGNAVAIVGEPGRPANLSRKRRSQGVRLPLVQRWTGKAGHRPLRERRLRSLKPLPPTLRWNAGRLYAYFGTSDQGLPLAPFDFSQSMSALCADIALHCDTLRHINTRQVLFTVTQARKHRQHGLQARITPLRFGHGALTETRHGRTFQVQRYFVGDVEILYLITFCLPRFLNQTFEHKLITVCHELYHISPEFDGDLRRHNGRYCIHTHSKKGYDRHMAALADEYLKKTTAPEKYAFLQIPFEQLHARHGAITGIVVPVPTLVPVV
jgi:hypothetical protein